MPRCLMEPAAKYCRRFFTQFIDLIPRRKLIIAQMLRSVRSFSRRFSPVLALRFCLIGRFVRRPAAITLFC